jgi:hypothetical protein
MNSVVPGLLRSVRWFESDVSGLSIGTIFKGQADVSLTLEGGADR